MDKATFGSIEKYASLRYIMVRLEELHSTKEGNYFNSFLTEFNNNLVALKILSNNHRYGYIIECVKNDYKIRLVKLDTLYDDKKLISHIRNFIYTKIREL